MKKEEKQFMSTYAHHSRDKQPGSYIENEFSREQEEATTLEEKAKILRDGDASLRGEERISLPDKLIQNATLEAREIFKVVADNNFNIEHFNDENCEMLFCKLRGLTEPAMVRAIAEILCENPAVAAKLSLAVRENG